jgi:hypothetical protein
MSPYFNKEDSSHFRNYLRKIPDHCKVITPEVKIFRNHSNKNYTPMKYRA